MSTPQSESKVGSHSRRDSVIRTRKRTHLDDGFDFQVSFDEEKKKLRLELEEYKRRCEKYEAEKQVNSFIACALNREETAPCMICGEKMKHTQLFFCTNKECNPDGVLHDITMKSVAVKHEAEESLINSDFAIQPTPTSSPSKTCENSLIAPSNESIIFDGANLLQDFPKKDIDYAKLIMASSLCGACSVSHFRSHGDDVNNSLPFAIGVSVKYKGDQELIMAREKCKELRKLVDQLEETWTGSLEKFFRKMVIPPKNTTIVIGQPETVSEKNMTLNEYYRHIDGVEQLMDSLRKTALDTHTNMENQKEVAKEWFESNSLFSKKASPEKEDQLSRTIVNADLA